MQVHASRHSEGGEVSPGPAPPMPTQRDICVERLVGLLKEMKPYLDSFGRAYCGGLGRDAKGRGGWPLDSQPVLSLLTYRHLDRHLTTPPRSAVDLARTIVVGWLWETRTTPTDAESSLPAVVKVILEMVEEAGDFVGSATEAEAQIREFSRQHPGCLRADETLPDSPDKVGLVLSQVGMVLLDHGVELFRPQRKDSKRLWAWRKLRGANDTRDTPDAKPGDVSGSGSAQQAITSGNDDGTDTYTPAQRRWMNAYQGDEPNDRSAA